MIKRVYKMIMFMFNLGYYEKLKQSGVKAQIMTIKGVPHGFWKFPGKYEIKLHCLTHLYLETRKRVIGKQCRPRSDATYCGV